MQDQGHVRPDDREWANHWPLVLTSLLGVSLATIGTYSAGLFLGPLEAEFGWSRAQVTSGLLIYALVAVPLSPFVGMAIDRWGARRLAIPGSIATGLAFSTFAFTNGSQALWWGSWALFSLAALTVKTTVWSTAVAGVFVRGRGLALAVALSGTGLASSTLPTLTELAITEIGWRNAYVAIGMGWSLATAILSYFFFVDVRAAPKAAGQGGDAPKVAGLSFREAIRLRSFQLLCLVMLVGSVQMIGLTIHLVPLLTSLGFDRAGAAGIVGALGVGSISGKLVSGFVFDRWSPILSSAVFQALPVLACGLLLQEAVDPWSAILAVYLLGFNAGASLTMASFLTARLVGMRAYGINFGIIASILALGTGIGPLVCGLVFDWYQSYRPVLIAGLIIPTICSLMITRIKLGSAPT